MTDTEIIAGKEQTNGELPAGWRIARFDEFALNFAMRVDPADAETEVYVGLEHLDPNSLRIKRWGTPDEVKGQKLLFEPGDIVFARRRAYQRKLGIAAFSGICSAHALVVRAIEERVDPRYLAYFMQSDLFMERAISISVGSLSPTINWKTLRRQEFPLPSLKIQRNLLQLFEATNDCIERKESLRQSLLIAKKATIRELTSKGISHTSFSDTILGSLPSSWKVLRLGEVFDFLDGQRVPIKKSDRAERSGPFPYYGASGIIDWIDDFIFDEPLILLGEDGANIVERNSPLAFKVEDKCWVNNHAHVLRVCAPNVLDFYVDYLESISYLAFKSGTAQPKLNKKACEGIPLPVPPIEEQHQITKAFLQFDDSINCVSTEIDRLNTFYRSFRDQSVVGGYSGQNV